MKILLISPAFPPANGYGGAPYVVYEIAERLVKKGCTVWVYTTDAKNSKERIYRYNKSNSKVKIVYFRNISNKFAYITKIFISPGMFFKLKKEINNFDVIHLHDFRTIQNIFVYLIARKKNKKIILQAHGSVNPEYLTKSKLKTVFDFLFGKKLIKITNLFIALNNDEKLHYNRFGVDYKKIKLVYNGIDVDYDLTNVSYGVFRRKFNISSSTKVVVFIGRIHPIKGLSLLIQSFFLLKRNIQDVKLIIIGPDDGDLRKIVSLSKKLGIFGDVVFTGLLYGIEKRDALIDSDILVLSSKYETFPIVILEAWIHKIPVVITKNCGISDLIIHEKAGLVADFNKNDFMKNMLLLLTNENLRKIMIENGLNLVKREFNWDKIIVEYLKIYKSLI